MHACYLDLSISGGLACVIGHGPGAGDRFGSRQHLGPGMTSAHSFPVPILKFCVCGVADGSIDWGVQTSNAAAILTVGSFDTLILLVGGHAVMRCQTLMVASVWS